jgi:hypothetical protein
MCLFYDKEGTETLKKRFNKDDTITCYKVYGVRIQRPYDNDGETKKYLVSPYFPNKKGSVIDEPQVVTADRSGIKMTARETRKGHVDKGIHVFVNKKAAKHSAALLWIHKGVVMPVKCKKKDFVAASKKHNQSAWEAVFKRVEITQENWDKLVERK